TITNCGNDVAELGGLTVSNFVNGTFFAVTNFPIAFQLLPGQTVTYSGSEQGNVCSATPDTIFVSGTDRLGSNVTSTCSATCTNTLHPSFTLTKICVANPVPFGAPVTIAGTFTNTGDVTLTNIIITDNQPVNPTRLVGPITLPPGGFTNFTSSYTP